MYEAIKKAVFGSATKPDVLAKILLGLCNAPVALASDLVQAGKSVANGTTLATVKASLPTTVALPNDLGLPVEATVTWGADTTPTYVPATAGEYVLSGTLSGLPSFLTNGSNKVAKVTITVAEA